jgi:hypothetical protein
LSSISINDSQPFLNLTINNVSLNFELLFDLYSKPDWIKDNGVGVINITNFNISIHLKPYNKNGKLQFDFSDAIIAVENYSADFKGTSDFSKALTLILNSFKSFFKKEVVNILARKIAKSFEDTYNAILYSGPSVISIGESGVSLNYSLTTEPLFHANYMAVPFDGSFVSSQSK